MCRKQSLNNNSMIYVELPQLICKFQNQNSKIEHKIRWWLALLLLTGWVRGAVVHGRTRHGRIPTSRRRSSRPPPAAAAAASASLPPPPSAQPPSPSPSAQSLVESRRVRASRENSPGLRFCLLVHGLMGWVSRGIGKFAVVVVGLIFVLPLACI
jgi:hypothetical protein